MPRTEAPPFGRGETFYNGNTIDPNNLGGTQHEGKEWEFEDIDLSQTGAKPARTNRLVTCRCVRNVSGIPLLPKRGAVFQKVGINYGARVDGYCSVAAERIGGIVDEWLPASGVVNNDLFWIVVKGPTQVLTGLAGDGTNVFNVGDVMVALAAGSSQATSAGRVTPQDLTGAAAALGNNVMNKLARALSAQTTGNTNASMLSEVYNQF